MAEPTRPGLPRARPGAVELPGIQPLVVTRLSDDLADQVRRLIIREDIGEGSRLPSERELAERFGASRPTVSQALRSLSLMGLVEIRRGSGAYVLRRPETMVTASVNLMLDLDEKSVTQLMQLRLWLETCGVEQAAAREPELSRAETDAVLQALDRLQAASGKISEWIADDTVFHATVVRSAGNPYLAAMYESVHTAILSFEYRQWVETESEPTWLRDMTSERQAALHEPIAQAVLQRDTGAATAAVLAHHEVMLDHLNSAMSTMRRKHSTSRERR